jgi:hypothetical protein
MSRVAAAVFCLALSAAALGALPHADPARAAEDAPADASAMKCADKPVSARGVGFLPSQRDSEEAARKAWLAKAQSLFADADWATAKEQSVICAKQGLYSNCTASAIPCGTEAGAEPEAPKAN